MKVIVGVLVLAAFLGVVAGCSGDDNTNEPTATASTDSPVTATSPSNPIVTDDGIEVAIEATVEAPFPPVTRTCKADGYVAVRDGEVVSVGDGWGRFKPQIGEAVYYLDGSRFVDPTLVTQPAYRATDGKLIVEWRECVVTPATGRECEDDGVIWARDGFVAEVVIQPSGKGTEVGEQVYGPDGLPFPDPTYVRIPVTRGEDGHLVYGWPKCEAKELAPGR